MTAGVQKRQERIHVSQEFELQEPETRGLRLTCRARKTRLVVALVVVMPRVATECCVGMQEAPHVWRYQQRVGLAGALPD